MSDKHVHFKELSRLIHAGIMGDECLTCFKIIKNLSLSDYEPMSLARFVRSQKHVSDDEVLIIKLPDHILIYADHEVSDAFCFCIGDSDVFSFEEVDDQDISSGEYIISRDDVTWITMKMIDTTLEHPGDDQIMMGLSWRIS